MEAFVYSWTNTATNQLYIGSHKGTPDDGYVCSSKVMLEDYMRDRTVFTRQIIATGSYEDMRAFEATLLNAVDAKKDPQFYNQSNGNGDFYLKRQTLGARRKISEAKKGKPRPDLVEMNRARRGEKRVVEFDRTGEKNGMFGKKHSEESKKKMSMNSKGKNRQPKSEETKEKMRQAALRRWNK
jgi:hypothetical protein